MLNYPRESLHWIQMAVFKPNMLKKRTRKFTRKQLVITFLKIYPVAAAIYSLLPLMAWVVVVKLAGYEVIGEGPFRLLIAALALGMVFGLLIGLLGVFLKGLDGGVKGGIDGVQIGMLLGGLSITLFTKLNVGLFLGLAFALLAGLAGRLALGLVIGLFVELVLVLVSPAVFGDNKVVVNYALAFLPFFLFTYFRPIYLLPYVVQYRRAKAATNPFSVFRNSPVHWDELIATPLPYLKDWLVSLVKHDRERGLGEILFVAENCPYQRKAALNALFKVIKQDLERISDFEDLAKAAELLKAFPAGTEALPKELKELDDARRRLNTISTLAQDYRVRLTLDGKLKVLGDLQRELEPFRSAMAFTPTPVGKIFGPLAESWLKMVREAETSVRARLQFVALPNPYVAGSALQPRDFYLLKGRNDIIRAIEKEILKTKQQLSLFLYGRRRTGKSSTLLNLPHLLSSEFEPVYIDCQDAKWYESDQAFCYNLARNIFGRLHQREAVKGIIQPQEKQFERNAFTRLDEYLDQFERLATERGKRILLAIDEYEGLEGSITGGDISKNVLGKLRNIIQHRQRIVVLVSGSHRFEELTGVNWASYFINTRTLELSFLDEPSARELLSEPVPQLRYEDGVLEEIIRLTHCQPLLLQAVASELVNHLNELQKTTATRADLDAAVNKVLTSAGAYFANTWREDNSPSEQTVLRAYAEGAGERVDAAEFQSALQSLVRKEMMERDGDGYRLAVPLFGLWILRNQVD